MSEQEVKEPEPEVEPEPEPEPEVEPEPEPEPSVKSLIKWDSLPDTECGAGAEQIYDDMIDCICDEKELSTDDVIKRIGSDTWVDLPTWKEIALWCFARMECEADLIEELFPTPPNV